MVKNDINLNISKILTRLLLITHLRINSSDFGMVRRHSILSHVRGAQYPESRVTVEKA